MTPKLVVSATLPASARTPWARALRRNYGFIKANHGVALTIRSGTNFTNLITVTADEVEARPGGAAA